MSEDEQLDGLTLMRAQIDQMAALAPEAARLARGWYDAYTAQGFSERQALYLSAAQVLQNPGVPPA